MTLLIFFIVLSIGISFLCSILEASLLSMVPSYIAQLEDKNPKLFKKVTKIKDNMDGSLAAILTLNTIAHTVGATGVGAQVAEIYGQSYIAIASGVMTFAILILSEIIPKTIGAKYWRELISPMCFFINIMIILLKPFLILSELITKMFGTSKFEPSVSDEIKALAKLGRDDKSLEDDKYRVICNIINLENVKVKDIMTPRTVTYSVTPEMTVEEFEKDMSSLPFSRFPVVEGDEVFLGYIHKSKILNADENKSLRELTNDIKEVSADTNVEFIFTEMLRDRSHMSVVFDDLGTWVGIVTMEDILETILGKEIVDETDQVTDMRKYAKIRRNKMVSYKRKISG